MPAPESTTTEQADQSHDKDRDRELVRAITDALVLAVGKRAAHQALRRARARSGRPAQHRAVSAAAHVAGYSALLGYIWHQRRTSHNSAAWPARFAPKAGMVAMFVFFSSRLGIAGSIAVSVVVTLILLVVFRVIR
jgi:hypothetical protein